MDMPKPGDAHRKLSRLVGEWIGEEVLHPSPFDPKGGPATGRIVNRPAVDGFTVVQDYQQERDGLISFRGLGVFGYDGAEGRHTLHWWDSLGLPPGQFRGTFEGDTLTLTLTMPQGLTRGTWHFQGTDVIESKMEMSGDGTTWHPFMEGRYRRRT